MYVTLEQGECVPMGNFTFFYEATQDDKIFEKLLECEKLYLLNYVNFAQMLRGVLEAIVLREETMIRRRKQRYIDYTDAEIRQSIINEIKASFSETDKSKKVTYKWMLFQITASRAEEFRGMLNKHRYLGTKNRDELNINYRPLPNQLRNHLKYFIMYLFEFGNKAVHNNESDDLSEDLTANKENCHRILYAFHDFLCVYYKKIHTFMPDMIPVNDYIPVPDDIVDKMGIKLDTHKKLYIKDNHYYIISKEGPGYSAIQKRDSKTICQLWEKSYDDPVNIIHIQETIYGADKYFWYRIFKLPGRPIALTAQFIKKLNMEERFFLIRGLIRGMKSLYCCSSPVNHRNLNPDAFMVFQLNNRYKLLLVEFSYSKYDNSNNIGKETTTVYFDLKKLAQDEWNNDFFAPELRGNDLNREDINWEKADVFSLGQMILFLYTGYVAFDMQDVISLSKHIGLDLQERGILGDMLSWDPDDRPALEIVFQVYNGRI